ALTRRFAAARVFIMQEDEGRWPTSSLLELPEDTPITQKALDKAVEDRRALSFALALGDGRTGHVFLAPLFYADQCEGMAVMTMASMEPGGDREAVLRLFSALCELAGPYVHAAREHD